MRGGIDALQCREFSALIQILARVQIRHAHPCTKRRLDGLACNDCFGALNLSPCDIQIRACAIHLFLSRGKIMTQILPAVEHRPRESCLRFLRLQFGLLDRHIKSNEHHARLDELPWYEPYLKDGGW